MAASIKQQLFGSGSSRAEHYVSTSDQEEEFTSVKPKTKKKYTLAVKQPGIQGKENNRAATSEAIAVDKEARRPPGTPKVPMVTTVKRPRETESDSDGFRGRTGKQLHKGHKEDAGGWRCMPSVWPHQGQVQKVHHHS